MSYIIDTYSQSPYICKNDTFYYKDSHLLYGYGSWKGDTLDGHWVFFDKKGVIAEEGDFKSGIPSGIWYVKFTKDLYFKGKYGTICRITRDVFTKGYTFKYTYIDEGWGFDETQKPVKRKGKEILYGLRNMRYLYIWYIYSREKNKVIEEKHYTSKGEFIKNVEYE